VSDIRAILSFFGLPPVCLFIYFTLSYTGTPRFDLCVRQKRCLTAFSYVPRTRSFCSSLLLLYSYTLKLRSLHCNFAAFNRFLSSECHLDAHYCVVRSCLTAMCRVDTLQHTDCFFVCSSYRYESVAFLIIVRFLGYLASVINQLSADCCLLYPDPFVIVRISKFVLWAVEPFGFVCRYQRFGRTHCLHLQD
jgi:hypothetical protein